MGSGAVLCSVVGGLGLHFGSLGEGHHERVALILSFKEFVDTHATTGGDSEADAHSKVRDTFLGVIFDGSA